MWRAIEKLTLAAAFATSAALAQEISLTEPVRVVGTEASRYGSIPMGGVEYATGLTWCARKPENLFLRADSGGIWKLDRSTSNRWVCLTDNLPFAWRDLVTVDSVAVHPDDPNTIYIAGGQRWGELHDILKTTDGGASWNRLMLTNKAGKPVTSDGNGENKQVGERLVVDVNAPDVLMFATRNDGLLRSEDAGQTWTRIDTFPSKGKSWAGLSFVAGDFGAGRPGELTQHWIVGVQPDKPRSVRGGIFETIDAGKNWSRIEGGPGLFAVNSTPMRMKFGRDGTAYLTTIGAGVWKCQKNVWVEITPPVAKSKPYCGIGLHPTDPNQLLISETSGQSDQTFYHSTDGGKYWRAYRYQRTHPARSNVDINSFPAWEMAGGMPPWGGNASDIQFDPIDPSRVWHTSLSGVCRIDGIGKERVSVSLVGDGREQMSCGEVICPTDGAPLISGVWDAGGFRHERLDQIPASRISRQERDGSMHPERWRNTYQDVFDMDVQPGSPQRIVLCGGWQFNQSGEAAYSTDNGGLFRAFAAKPFDAAKYGRIAIGVTPDNVVWAPMGSATTPIYLTKDNGASWTPCDGAPTGMVASDGIGSYYRFLAADRVKQGVFYLYDRRDGQFFRSDSGGEKFIPFAKLPTQQGVHSDWHRLEAAPWRAEDVWLSLQEQGLLRSTDGGKTWRKLQGITWAENFAFGKPRVDGEFPALYLFGQIGGEKPTLTTVDCRLYRSDDAGATWVQLNDPTMQFACIAAGMAGDMQTYGRVYVSTAGRGVFYVQRPE